MIENKSETQRNESYDPAHFLPLFAAEDRHFWFVARNRVIAVLTAQIVRDWPEGYRVLEVGCGTGNVLRVLRRVCRNGRVVGMDLFDEGLRYAQRRVNVPLIQGDMHCAPLDSLFEMIGLFDVLEHLPDDIRVLKDLRGLLQPGGVLMLTVPAHPTLWSYFDEAACHQRRYTLPELENKLRAAGYEIEYATEFMCPLFPLVWGGRRLAAVLKSRRDKATKTTGEDVRSHQKNLEMSRQELRVVPFMNGLLLALLRQEERFFVRRRRLPFGTSILVIARNHSTHYQAIRQPETRATS